jgi:hypothetical protein
VAAATTSLGPNAILELIDILQPSKEDIMQPGLNYIAA